MAAAAACFFERTCRVVVSKDTIRFPLTDHLFFFAASNASATNEKKRKKTDRLLGERRRVATVKVK